MSLIKCKECGKEYSDAANACPDCGAPSEKQKKEVQNKKGVLSICRLVIGIISCVLFPLVTLQSCAAGVSNALQSNGEVSGSAGFLLALGILVAGIVGIATRNSLSKVGPIVSAVFYAMAALIAAANVGTYSDLAIWAGISGVFAIIFIIAAILTRKTGR